MRSRLLYVLWLAIALACGTALAQDNTSNIKSIRWAPDLTAARKASMEYKVPVLLHFYGDNCLPCKVLEQNVLSKPEVVEALNKHFICVRINATQQRQVAAEFGVHSWPTDVFLSPDGKLLDQGLCKQNAGEYLGVLRNIAVMNRDRNTMLAAQHTADSKQVTSQTMAYAPPAVHPTANAGSGIASSHLPDAGTLPAFHPSGPNFYTHGVDSAMQQLPGSLTPNAGVSGGPVQAQHQPHAISTAVGAEGNQIAGASQPHAFQAPNSQLTASTTAGRLPSSTPWPSAADQANAFHQMPAIPLADTQFAGTQTNGNQMGWNQPAPTGRQQTQVGSAVAGTAQMVDNPHFLPYPPATMVGSQPDPTFSSNRVAANTVAFQPRNASSAMDANATTTAGRSAAMSPSGDSPKAAIEGYCPVTLKQQGGWVKGQPEFAVRHRGQVYWMNSKAAMEQFLTSPDNSSPVLSGYDAMVFLNEGKLVEGKILHGLHEQNSGAILLFSTAESKAAYEQDFDRNTKALDMVLKTAGVK